jgi:hypothetical protein
MARLLFALLLVALETTAVSLPLTALAAGTPPWPLLAGATLLGLLADQAALRLQARLERPTLLAGALLAAALVIGGGLGLGPLGALGALIPGGPAVAQAYALLLLALLLFWRGTRVDTRDSAGVGALFTRGAAASVAGLLVGAIFGTGRPPGSPAILGQIVALVGLGLLALAVSHAQEAAGGRLGGLDRRWLLTLLAAVGVVLAVALGAAGLLGQSEATAAIQGLLRLILLPFALVGGAIVWLILALFAEPLRALIAALLARLRGLEPPPVPDNAFGEQQGQAVFETITRIANGATFLLALIPIAILVAAILIMRRRARPRPETDEERESLGALASLAGDLRELLAGLRNPFARRLAGLRAALAALEGHDPTTRARRAYVRLLLLLEGREHVRPPARTPAEFAPEAAAALDAAEPVARLTAAYERARYDPTGASPAMADDAEAALRDLDRS